MKGGRPRARVILEDCGIKVFDIIGDAEKVLDRATELFRKKYLGGK